MAQSWWEIVVEGADMENIIYTAESTDGSVIEGVQCDTETSGKVFVKTNGSEPTEIIAAIEGSGGQVVSATKDNGYDWNAHVQKTWEPFSLGSFTVIPLVEAKPSAPLKSSEIYIIPGSGFGTGHSLTTQTTLTLLESLKEGSALKPQGILDVGTGSGILAICASKLFSAQVTAVDISELAINNAQENCELNGLENEISLSVGSTLFINQTFDLVIANIEIGIQLDLIAEYNRLVEKGGFLVLGGLRDQVRGEQMEQLLNTSGSLSEAESKTWRLTSSDTKGEWSAFVFQRLISQRPAKFLP
jgi:ribosomal protein L11 methyltransferase